MTENTDLLVRIREAMESDSIARKNITLFEALREIERLRVRAVTERLRAS